MIQHIKRLHVYLFVYILFYSCNTQEVRNGVWYHTKAEQFALNKSNEIETIFNPSSEYIIIRNDSIFFAVGDTITPTCIAKSDLIKESLDLNINGSDEDRIKIKSFLNNQLDLDEKNFKGLYMLDCPPPLNKLFDFGDKFLIREYGVYYHVFEKNKPIAEKPEEVKVDLNKLAIYNLPIDYEKSESLNFKQVEGVFSEIYMEGISLLRLPKINDLNPILIKGSSPSGEDNYYLGIFDDRMKMLDNLIIMYLTETEQGDSFGVLLTSFSIDNNYQIIIKEGKSLNDRKLIETKTYRITEEGKIEKVE